MSINKAIKYHLELSGATQYKLAARMIVGRSVVHNLLKDSANPTYYTLQRVAKALNIKVSDIILTAESINNEINSSTIQK